MITRSKSLLLLSVMAALSIVFTGCGLESAGTTATAGATKQIELEQARRTQERVQEQVQQSMDQMQKRNEQLDGAMRQ